MDNLEITLESVKKDVEELEYRIEKIEVLSANINRLVTSVEVMATNMKSMAQEQHRLADAQDKADERIRSLEMHPAEQWDIAKRTVWTCVLSGVCGAVIGAVLPL